MNTPNPNDVVALIRKNYLPSAYFMLEPIFKGEENHNFFIITDGSACVLRLYSLDHSTTGRRRKADIEFELAFIEHLHRHQVPTPQVVPALDGAKVAGAVVDDQARWAVLFEFVHGEEAVAYNAQIARAVAEVLLQVRKASRSFQYEAVRPWPGNIVEHSLLFYQQHHPQAGPYRSALDEIFNQASAGYEHIQDAGLPTGIIHGDIKLGNLLFEGGQIRAVIDFDDYRESYLLEELTRTLLHDLDSPSRNAIRAGYLHEFLTVFESDPSFTPAEQAALGTFLKARFLYDVTSYLNNGLTGLVDELFEDKHVREAVLADLAG